MVQMDPNIENIAKTTIAIIIAIVVLFISYFKWSYRYWFNRNMPFLQPKIPFGNSENPTKRTTPLAKRLERHYQSFKQRGHKHGGIFMMTKPIYFPVDLDYIKNVLSTDFQYFHDRGSLHNEKADPLSAHLFHLAGKKWKNLRAKLTPTFSSGKIKMMFPTLVNCTEPMIDYISTFCDGNTPLDVKHTMSSFTLDVIGSCAFGIDCNSFKDKNSDFLMYGQKIFQPNKIRAIKTFIAMACPSLIQALNISITPTDITEFYRNVVRQTIEYREKNNVSRNDFMQILMELRNSESDSSTKLTMDQITAQSFLFFVAGFDTTSVTLTYCLLELAYNPDIQNKLRNEINATLKRHNGVLSYEAIFEMKYLTQVIEETLRKYPPAVVLSRQCIMNYKIPDTDLTLEKGTTVMIPVYAVHRDPEFYPEPEKFDPERFSDENKAARHPYSFIPFGEGPRVCIGIRFAMMETKIALTNILQNFSFSPVENFTYPVEFAISAFILTPKEKIFLNVQKLN